MIFTLLCFASPVFAQLGSWAPARSMPIAKMHHTATLLLDGRVLIVGGETNIGLVPGYLSSVELYDPRSGVWLISNSLNSPRSQHSATLLPDGRVLVLGGLNESGPVNETETFDPLTATWSTVAPPGPGPSPGRFGHTATLMDDGRVVIIGGKNATAYPAESLVFDPSDDSWAPGPVLVQGRWRQTATLLQSGAVLVVGGERAPANGGPTSQAWRFTYHSATESWSSFSYTPALTTARYGHTATLVGNGIVVVTGGYASSGDLNPETSVELLVGDTWSVSTVVLPSPAADHTATLLTTDNLVLVGGGIGAFTFAGTCAVPTSQRAHHTAVLLPTGHVMVAGGLNLADPLGTVHSSVEVFLASSGGWAAGPSLSVPRFDHTITALPDGRALAVGGQCQDRLTETCPTQWGPYPEAFYDSAEILEEGLWRMVASTMSAPRMRHSATLLVDGQTVLVTGGGGDAGIQDSAELFDAATESWQATGSMSQARYEHVGILLPDGSVLVAGGRTVFETTSSAEVYDPHSGTWHDVDSMHHARAEARVTLLADGQVLVIGGDSGIGSYLASAEIFNPATGSWTLTETMNLDRSEFTASQLFSGFVLVAGGETATEPSRRTATCEVFDPVSGHWTFVPSLHQARQNHTATLLPDGRVLVAGGKTDLNPNGGITSEVYDPKSQQWTELSTFSGNRMLHKSVLRPSGEVLMTGGIDKSPYLTEDSTQVFGWIDIEDNWRPVITDPPNFGLLIPGTELSVSGEGFGGFSEGSGGRTNSSPVNYPLVALRSLDGERTLSLSPIGLANFSDDPMTLGLGFDIPEGAFPGWYRLWVTTAGVPSDSISVRITCGAGFTTGTPLTIPVVDLGDPVVLSVDAVGARNYQWQRCTSSACPGSGWFDFGDNSSTYTIENVDSSHVGNWFRVRVESVCAQPPYDCDRPGYPESCATSNDDLLTVSDTTPPMAMLLHPSGGEYWLISDPDTGDPPNTQLITWSMSDDIRICQVDVSLWSSDDGGLSYTCVNGCAPDGSGLPATFGPGGTCVSPGESTTSVEYTVPISPPSGTSGSLYKVQVEVTDHAGLTTTVRSANPFYIVQPNPDSVKTLILANLDRMETEMGATPTQTAELTTKLYELADHPRVLGLVVDLGAITELQALYSAWDASPSDYDLANAVLFGTDGIHELLLDLHAIYSGVEHVVLVGDDRIIPFARIPDGATLFPESNYPAGGDLTATGTTVGRALAADRFLSDDPLVVLDPVETADLDDNLFVPDFNIGRLVESTEEITTTIATFISQDGVLDLTTLDPVTGHKVLVTGYDFLLDSAKQARSRWKAALGIATPDGSIEPVDGSLISSSWGLGTVAERRDELFAHVSGNSASPYAIASLNGHATHHGEGVPGTNPFDIEGLDAVHIFGDDGCAASDGPIDLAGAVLYSPGCHGGLPVPGACSTDSEHSLDLAQTMLARGAQAYVANTGYGWGLVHGIGYGERLVELFSEEMTAGGTVAVGEVLTRSKTRYVLETPRLDAYDAKSLMQWTLYGLPMYAVRTGISPDGPSLLDNPLLESTQIPAEQRIGAVTVQQALADSGDAPLPPYLMRLEMHFDLTASEVYTKRNASGDVITGVPGCPDPLPGEPEGCYYTLNGIVERGSGATDLPIQPYLVLDSRLSGTSQHGVLWLGGVYDEESDWVPVISELISNGGDGSNHGSIARKAINRPTGTRILDGYDPDDCRPSDLELNGLVVTTGEAVKLTSADPIFDIERLYRGFDLEVLYYNNSDNAAGNCDRDGPLFPEELDPDDYYQLIDDTLEWVVPVSDTGEIWRVVVVYTDNTVDGDDQGRWLPLDLSDDGTGSTPTERTFRGSMDISGIDTLTFVVQAVDKRGNVSWLEYQATQLPASGVELGIPMPVDVGDSQLFADGFESGNVSMWSSSVP